MDIATELAGTGQAQAHYAKGQILRAQRRYAEAIPEYEAAIAFNRNWAGAFHALAACKLFAGSIDEVIPLEEQAIRLSPRDPVTYLFYEEIGLVHLLQSRIDEAIVWLEKARYANPEHPAPHIRLASAYALKGETERAAVELAEARRVVADDRYASITRLKAVGNVGMPKTHALFEATYFAAQGRNAGGVKPTPASMTATLGQVDSGERPIVSRPCSGTFSPFRRGFGRVFRGGGTWHNSGARPGLSPRDRMPL